MIEEDTLRYHYEQELALLRRSLRAFGNRHPEAAARLSIVGEHSEDAHVERLLQSFALMAARISAKLGDDYPELSEMLLGILDPQCLRRFPSASIAQFDIAGMFAGRSAHTVIARGTELLSKAGKYAFRCAYDVVLAPLRISATRYAFAPNVPRSMRLSPDTSGMLSITLSTTEQDGCLDQTLPSIVRIHLAGSREIAASLADAMLLHASAAFVESSAGYWTRLEAVPIKQAGFGPGESMLQPHERELQPFELLGEYFSFARRFDFVDIDFAALVRVAGPDKQLTLHLAVSDIAPNSRMAQQLSTVRPEHLKLFCTPVVNLFTLPGIPLKLDPATETWPVKVKHKGGALTEVWSIDHVRSGDGHRVAPFASLAHGSTPSLAGPWWAFMQWHIPESPKNPRPVALTLVGEDGRQARFGIRQLTVDVTCSNGNAPRSLPIGAPEGDLQIENIALVDKITLLHPPTPIEQLSRADGALWRLLAQHTPHAIRLDNNGLEELKVLFREFSTLSAPTGHIDWITRLAYRPVMHWIMMKPQPAFVRGLEITLTIDPGAFASDSVAAFASVMERFFAPYAPETSFVQLIVVSESTGGVIRRGEPITGAAPII